MELDLTKKICGIDEAGRGPTAGPVCAAAVIFTDKTPGELIQQLNDSKKLTEKKREQLASEIKQHTVWAISWASHTEIDKLNIHYATLSAMGKAYKIISRQNESHEITYVDGKFTPEIQAPSQAIIKGDSKVPQIMAASILAKTERDTLMKKLALKYNLWEFEKHKGYPTKRHRELCREHGICRIHRKSFKII